MHAHGYTENGTDAILYIVRCRALIGNISRRVFWKISVGNEISIDWMFPHFPDRCTIDSQIFSLALWDLSAVISCFVFIFASVKFLKRNCAHALVVCKTISKPPPFTLILSIHQSYFDVSMRRLSYCLGSASSHAHKQTCAIHARRYRNRARMHARVRGVHGI